MAQLLKVLSDVKQSQPLRTRMTTPEGTAADAQIYAVKAFDRVLQSAYTRSA